MPSTTEQVRAVLDAQRSAALDRYNKATNDIENLLEAIKSLNEGVDKAKAIQNSCEKEAEELRTAIAILEHADQNEDIQRFSRVDKKFFIITPHRFRGRGSMQDTPDCGVVFGPYGDADLCKLLKDHPIHSDPNAPNKQSFATDKPTSANTHSADFSDFKKPVERDADQLAGFDA